MSEDYFIQKILSGMTDNEIRSEIHRREVSQLDSVPTGNLHAELKERENARASDLFPDHEIVHPFGLGAGMERG